jgi:hypothetical protein
MNDKVRELMEAAKGVLVAFHQKHLDKADNSNVGSRLASALAALEAEAGDGRPLPAPQEVKP